jgi:hypothetical protein
MLQSRARYAKFTNFRENLVTTIMAQAASDALEAGKSVIISDTNLDPNRNKAWAQMATDFKVQYREKLFTNVPYGVCIDRDSKREHPVGQRVITGMFDKYRDIYWPAPQFTLGANDAYMFDVDGTIAQMKGRNPHDWEKAKEDLPKQDVIRIAQALSTAGYDIIVLSGRNGQAEADTRVWMEQYGMPFDHFWIRSVGDTRSDYIIKEELYRNHIEGNFNIRGVFDDRDQVVHLWRHLGLTTMQVNYGSF